MKNLVRQFSWRAATAGLLALALFAGTAEAQQRVATQRDGAQEQTSTARQATPATAYVRQPAAQIVVSPVDPAQVMSSRTLVKIPVVNQFNALKTLNVYILAMYDRLRLNSRPFDQRLRLYLPDGNLYEERVVPCDPAGAAGRTIKRADLGPNPVEIAVPQRLVRLSRALPAGTIDARLMRDGLFTSQRLMVAGTWITENNLYGLWTAQVDILQDGKVVSSTRTTFRLSNQ
ncbi:MAG TPA: hypothetical protein PKG80_08730 [Acidobacteriota bacterium]|nr:hypothetical protein [Acidobacteriota bacterium]